MDRRIFAKYASLLASVCVAVGVLMWLYGRKTDSQNVLLLIGSQALIGIGLLILGLIAIRTK